MRSINIRRGKLQAETLMDPARAVLGPLMVGGVMAMVMAEVVMVAVVMLRLDLSLLLFSFLLPLHSLSFRGSSKMSFRDTEIERAFVDRFHSPSSPPPPSHLLNLRFLLFFFFFLVHLCFLRWSKRVVRFLLRNRRGGCDFSVGIAKFRLGAASSRRHGVSIYRLRNLFGISNDRARRPSFSRKDFEQIETEYFHIHASQSLSALVFLRVLAPVFHGSDSR